jgi:hypothetical protein
VFDINQSVNVGEPTTALRAFSTLGTGSIWTTALLHPGAEPGGGQPGLRSPLLCSFLREFGPPCFANFLESDGRLSDHPLPLELTTTCNFNLQTLSTSL